MADRVEIVRLGTTGARIFIDGKEITKVFNCAVSTERETIGRVTLSFDAEELIVRNERAGTEGDG